MQATTTIPVTIEPEAAAFIEEVGQRVEFEAILEHAQQTIPSLRELVVKLHDYPETGPPSILIDAYREPLPTGFDGADTTFSRWKIQTFSPEVCVNFTLISAYSPHER